MDQFFSSSSLPFFLFIPYFPTFSRIPIFLNSFVSLSFFAVPIMDEANGKVLCNCFSWYAFFTSVLHVLIWAYSNFAIYLLGCHSLLDMLSFLFCGSRQMHPWSSPCCIAYLHVYITNDLIAYICIIANCGSVDFCKLRVSIQGSFHPAFCCFLANLFVGLNTQ